MEIRMIEGKTFEKLKMSIADLLAQINTLYAEPENGWLDNQAVCQILNISKRSLQTFRDKGL
ncbi:MAG: DNA-binding protein, partial [Prevotella sp.]|nr:DNA-binding protein [Prevotella sp.]